MGARCLVCCPHQSSRLAWLATDPSDRGARPDLVSQLLCGPESRILSKEKSLGADRILAPSLLLALRTSDLYVTNCSSPRFQRVVPRARKPCSRLLPEPRCRFHPCQRRSE